MRDIKACMHNLSKANYHFPRCNNFAQFFPPCKGIRASFARGIRNIGFWNPENSSRNPESHKRLESGIQVPPSKSGVESRIQHCLGHPYGAICMIRTVKPQTKWRQSNKSTDVVFILEDSSDRLETSLVFNLKQNLTNKMLYLNIYRITTVHYLSRLESNTVRFKWGWIAAMLVFSPIFSFMDAIIQLVL